MSGKTYYEIIGLKQDASYDEIKRQCREMVARVHPDRGESSLRHLFPIVVEAKETLLEPGARAAYDKKVQRVDIEERPSAESAVAALCGTVARPKERAVADLRDLKLVAMAPEMRKAKERRLKALQEWIAAEEAKKAARQLAQSSPSGSAQPQSAQPKSAPRNAPSQSGPTMASLLKWGLVGAGIGAGFAALFSNDYDKRANRYRRSNGTFASGRFD